MKTILRIIMILFVAAVVAGAFSLAVDSSSTTSGTNEDVQLPAMTSADGQPLQPMERPEGGDRDGGSVTQGLSGVLATLMKLTGITMFILLIQKTFRLIGNRKFAVTHR